jgi:phosphomannomutase
MLARDIPVALSVTAVPTQMSSYEVVQRGAAAGIVITASHNPWTDNGFKVKAPSGAAAGHEILSVLEDGSRNGPRHRAPSVRGRGGGRPRGWFDPFPGYEQFVRTHAGPGRAEAR